MNERLGIDYVTEELNKYTCNDTYDILHVS